MVGSQAVCGNSRLTKSAFFGMALSKKQSSANSSADRHPKQGK
jgi:hypothetical protein